MKNIISRRACISSIMAAALLPSKLRAEAKEIGIVVYDNFQPNSFIDENGEWNGFYIDLTERLLAGLDDAYDIRFDAEPAWARVLLSLENGDYDLSFEVSFREERTSFIDYLGATDVESAYLVLPKSNPVSVIEDIDQFADVGLQISFNRAVKWDEEFDDRIANDLDFQENFALTDGATTTEANFENGVALALSAGRYDAYMMTHATAFKTLEFADEFYAQNTEIAIPMKVIPITAFGTSVTYVGASRKMPQALRDQMRQNYQDSRADGSFDEIWHRWNGSRDTPPNVEQP